jgi:hypothetical protein
VSHINQETNELVQSDIDGTISEEDRIRLQLQLETDDKACGFHADCRRLSEALDTLEPLEVPAGIAATVLAQIAAVEESPVAQEERVPWRTLFALWFEFPVLRYAMAFLIGAVFASGISQMRMTDERGMDVAGLGGTMSSMSQFASRQSFNLAQTALEGQIDMLHAEQLVQLRFALDSKLPIEVVISFGGASYDFSGFLQDSNTVSSLTVENGQVTLITSGEQHFTVQLSASAVNEAPIEVSFNSDGETIETLTVAPVMGQSP